MCLEQENKDPDALAPALQKVIIRALNKLAPLRRRRFREKKNTWFQPYLFELIANRDHFHELWWRTRSLDNWRIYVFWRNRVRTEIAKCKRSHITSQLEKAYDDPRKWWEHASKLGDFTVRKVDDPALSAESFKRYFMSVVQDLVPPLNNGIANGQPHDDARPDEYNGVSQFPSDNVFDVPPINTAVLRKIVSHLPSHGTGSDKIPTSVLKYACHSDMFASALCRLYNRILQSGVYPQCLKVSLVRPCHKRGPTNDEANYRPLSIGPCMSKPFEKYLDMKIRNFLDDSNYFFIRQSGFRGGHSCTTALSEITEHLNIARDKRLITGVVFLDLKKAFDIVDHTLLIDRCRRACLSASLCSVIRSFLTGRRHFISYNARCSSTSASPGIGVPQGSTIAPLLFTIFINSLPSILRECMVHVYADDVTIWYSAKTLAAIERAVQPDIAAINTWCSSSRLIISAAKTKAMLLGSTQRILNLSGTLQLRLGDTDIEVVDKFTLLGLTIDSRLSFSDHISRICSSAGMMLSKLRRLRNCLTLSQAKLLLHAFILSRFRYALPIIFCYANVGDFNRLEILYRSSLRVLLQTRDYRVPSTALYDGSGLPPLGVLAKADLALFFHRIVVDLSPLYLSQFVMVYEHAYCTRSSSRPRLVSVHRYRRATGGNKSIIECSSRLYYELPQNITCLPYRRFSQLVTKYINPMV